MSDAVDMWNESDEISVVSEDVLREPPPRIDATLQSRRDPGSAQASAEPAAPSSRPALTSGRLLGARYRLQHQVGAGGMGEVWAAEHVRLHMPVAVKVLLPKALGVPEIVARFEREARLLARLHSEHVPNVIDFFVDEAFGPTLVTELVDGRSLADVIRTPMSLESAVELGIQVATAIGEVHRGSVVHRDLKPSNVMMCRGPAGAQRAVILDLGVSRLVSEDGDQPEMADITTGDVVVGTIEYMAPEQILRCGAVTPGADLYALGALLFRAITGGHVFGSGLDKMDLVRAKLASDAPKLKTGRDDALSRRLAVVVGRALERNPSARYVSAEELLGDLVSLRELAVRPEVAPCGEVTQDRRARGPARHARKARRGVLAVATAAALLVAMAVWARTGEGEMMVVEGQTGFAVDPALHSGAITMTMPMPWTPNQPQTPAPETGPDGPVPEPIHRPLPEEPWRSPVPAEPPGPDPI